MLTVSHSQYAPEDSRTEHIVLSSQIESGRTGSVPEASDVAEERERRLALWADLKCGFLDPPSRARDHRRFPASIKPCL